MVRPKSSFIEKAIAVWPLSPYVAKNRFFTSSRNANGTRRLNDLGSGHGVGPTARVRRGGPGATRSSAMQRNVILFSTT